MAQPLALPCPDAVCSAVCAVLTVWVGVAAGVAGEEAVAVGRAPLAVCTTSTRPTRVDRAVAICRVHSSPRRPLSVSRPSTKGCAIGSLGRAATSHSSSTGVSQLRASSTRLGARGLVRYRA